MHREHRLRPAPRVTFQQNRRAGVGHRSPLGQHGRERLSIAKAEVNTLAGQWMHAVRGVADEREAQGDRRRQAQEAQRKAGGRRDALQRAERPVTGVGNALRQCAGLFRQQRLRERIGRRPDHRHSPPRQRKPSEHAAVVAEPLVGTTVMCALAREIRDDGGLAVGLGLRHDAGRFAHPRSRAVGADDQPCIDGAPVRELQRCRGRRPRELVERRIRDHVDARTARRTQQRRAKLALLDDPRQRALSQVVSGEVDRAAAVAFDVHRFDGSDALAVERLPSADCAQKSGATGADRVDARVECLGIGLDIGQGTAIDQRHGKTGSRERGRKREADQARANDHDIVMSSHGDQSRTRS